MVQLAVCLTWICEHVSTVLYVMQHCKQRVLQYVMQRCALQFATEGLTVASRCPCTGDILRLCLNAPCIGLIEIPLMFVVLRTFVHSRRGKVSTKCGEEIARAGLLISG
jgi:hypothetical protein